MPEGELVETTEAEKAHSQLVSTRADEFLQEETHDIRQGNQGAPPLEQTIVRLPPEPPLLLIRRRMTAFLKDLGFKRAPRPEVNSVKSFLPLRQTLKAARVAGLSLGDYIDARYQFPGLTQQTIDRLATLGVFNIQIDRVCEIGPGSGRYLERVLQRCKPTSYEIYEPAREWSNWLAKTHRVIPRQCDGISLCDTRTASVDLVLAHRVFVYLAFIVTFQYFLEMIRVAKDGAYIAFDIISEPCMPDATIEKWAAAQVYHPCMIPRDMAIAFFARRRCSLHASFFIPSRLGLSEYLVFVKNQASNPKPVRSPQIQEIAQYQ
jgi:Methyltransferase domain